MRVAVAVVSILAHAAASPAAAQQAVETAPAKFTMSKEYRAVQQAALATQRKLMLSFADSMPERLYRDRATPPQRSFADQVFHIVSANQFIAARFIGGPAPARPDTAALLNSRAGLKKYITDTFDSLDKLLADQPDADRDVQVKFFGNFIPRWQVWDELNQHTMWTAGQVVANFRKNGMAPPAFLFF